MKSVTTLRSFIYFAKMMPNARLSHCSSLRLRGFTSASLSDLWALVAISLVPPSCHREVVSIRSGGRSSDGPAHLPAQGVSL